MTQILVTLEPTLAFSVNTPLPDPATALPILAPLARGEPGPPGPPGVATVNLLAAENLSGHKAVYAGAGGLRLANNAALQTSDVLGITTAATLAAQLATVQTKDLLTEPSWNWQVGPVYLGSNGNLTQTPPLAGVQVEVGTATSATTLLVRSYPPIVLN